MHVDARALSGSDDNGGCLLEDGPPLAAETARRLACDASLLAAGDRDGQMRLGRRKRTVPVALRRALHARDGGCRFPGCDNRRFLHAHHIRHWARGGETSLDNLLLLCSRHHRLVHEGGYGLDEHLRFDNRQGKRLPAIWPPTRGDPTPLRTQTPQKIGPNTCTHGSGEQINLTDTADALLHAAAPRATGVEASARGP